MARILWKRPPLLRIEDEDLFPSDEKVAGIYGKESGDRPLFSRSILFETNGITELDQLRDLGMFRSAVLFKCIQNSLKEFCL